MQQMYRYPVEGHGRPECPAEVNQGRAYPGIRVEWFIGKTNRMAGTAGEPSDKDMNGAQFIGFL
jgi:hypothetical protein